MTVKPLYIDPRPVDMDAVRDFQLAVHAMDLLDNSDPLVRRLTADDLVLTASRTGVTR